MEEEQTVTSASWVLRNCHFAGVFEDEVISLVKTAAPSRKSIQPHPYDVFLAHLPLNEAKYPRCAVVLEVRPKSVVVAPMSTKVEYFDPRRKDFKINKDHPDFGTSGLAEDSMILGQEREIPDSALISYKGHLSKGLLDQYRAFSGRSTPPPSVERPIIPKAPASTSPFDPKNFGVVTPSPKSFPQPMEGAIA